MKTGKIMLLFTVVTSLIVMACDMYDDGIPAKAVRKEFKSMYPDAKDVEWEHEGRNWSVSFEIGKHPDKIEYDALYDTAGNWIMTQNDVLLADVPAAVKGYLAASEYGNLPYADRDAEFYQTPTGDFYRLELIRDGRDFEVDVTLDGKVTPALTARF